MYKVLCKPGFRSHMSCGMSSIRIQPPGHAGPRLFCVCEATFIIANLRGRRLELDATVSEKAVMSTLQVIMQSPQWTTSASHSVGCQAVVAKAGQRRFASKVQV